MSYKMSKINELYMPMLADNTPGSNKGSVKSITKAELEKSTKSIATNRGSQPKLNKVGSNKNSFFVHNGAS